MRGTWVKESMENIELGMVKLKSNFHAEFPERRRVDTDCRD